jgi:CIC family chloride channel protein
MLVTMPVAFAALGAVSLVFPEVLGNGQSLAGPAFAAQLTLGAAAALFFVKGIATVTMIGAGAYGGTLTPSLSLGALFGLVTGGLWTSFWPGSSLPAFAVCGAAAFLAGSMAAPLTALALTIEFTGGSLPVLLPMVVAVSLSTLVRWLLDARGRPAPFRLRRLERTEPAAEERVQT